MPKYRRRIRLIRPKLQIRLMASFLGIAVLALALQYMVFLRVLTETALTLPNDGAVLMTELTSQLGMVFMISMLLLLPASFAVGLLVTHRVAGPIHRFETYLRQVIAGETREACRLRKGDELKELCELINRATESVRASKPSDAAPPTGAQKAA